MAQAYFYEICLEGTLTGPWSDWFEGLAISHPVEGETVLSGPLPDQSALIGLLTHIHNLNLGLVSVVRRTGDGGRETGDGRRRTADGTGDGCRLTADG